MTEATIPPVSEAELHAYVDGQLPPGGRPQIEAWLGARPEEAERIAAYRHLNEELRALYGPVLGEPTPERLRAPLARPRSRGQGRWQPYGLAAAYLLIGVAVGALAGWHLHAARAPAPVAVAGIVKPAALAHATYTPEVRHAVEVGADQEAHLVGWLSKRLGTTLRAPKLEANGFSLVGGRLLPGAMRPTGGPAPVAQFMYQTQAGRRLTLYVRNEADTRETAFRFAQESGVGVFYWIDRNIGYALSSADLSREELLAVANSVYRQLNP